MQQIRHRVMETLKQAKVLYFPDYQGSGHQYLNVGVVQVQPEPYQFWATVQTNAGELLVTSDVKIDSMLDYFLQSGQKKTVLHYQLNNDSICEVHTDWLRLVQYGEYRTKDGMMCYQHAIHYPMVNGIDERIPF